MTRPLGSWRDEPRGPTSESMRARAMDGERRPLTSNGGWLPAFDADAAYEQAFANGLSAYDPDDGRAHAAQHRDEPEAAA